jgi:NAD(P)-dependent dehydrogenase (short-subunit alcohol dehydrogenase family)
MTCYHVPGRGIGLELCRQLQAKGHQVNVRACATESILIRQLHFTLRYLYECHAHPP